MCSWYFYAFLLIAFFILFPRWTSWFSSPSMLLFWKSLLLLLDCSASLRSTLVFSGWQFPKLQSRAVNIYMSRFMIYFAFKIYLILTLARFVFENQNYVVSIRLRLNKKKRWIVIALQRWIWYNEFWFNVYTYNLYQTM